LTSSANKYATTVQAEQHLYFVTELCALLCARPAMAGLWRRAEQAVGLTLLSLMLWDSSQMTSWN